MLRFEDEEITLRASDSFSIPGDVPHRTYSCGGATTRAIWVNAPVILPKEATHRVGKAQGGHRTRVGGTPNEREASGAIALHLETEKRREIAPQ